jgi:PAS domain S-box-containing protein
MICRRTLLRILNRRFARVRIGVLGGLFITAMLALAVLEIVSDYRHAITDTERRLESQARSLAEQTARSAQVVDVALRHIAEHVKTVAAPSGVSSELHDYLREQTAGLEQLDGLAIHSADGTQLAVSWQFPPPTVDVTGRQFFSTLRDDPQRRWYIDVVPRSLSDGNWFFLLARRLEDKAGRFAGIVYARCRVDYFQHFYDAIQLEPGTVLALLNGEGALLARHPSSNAALGMQFELPATLLASLASEEGRAVRSKSSADGIERIWAMRPVPGYPMLLTLSQDNAAALAPWRERAIRNGVKAGTLSVAGAILLAFLMRLLKRLYATRDSLEASEARYERAMTASNAGHWDWNLITDEEYFSPRVKELYGLPKDRDITTATQFFEQSPVHPDDRQRRRQALQDHLAGKTARYEIEYRVQPKPGEIRWLHVRGLCFRDWSGKPIRLAGSAIDVTARKEAEQALRRSEERFALAIAGSDDGLWDWNLDGDQVFCSPRAQEILRLPPGPEYRPRVEGLATIQFHPEDEVRRQAALEAHLAGRQPVYGGEFRVSDQCGGYRWVRIRGVCLRDAEGRPYRMAGSVGDIDAQKRAEVALRESEERFALAMTGSDEGHWDWNMRSGEMYLSPRHKEMYGFSPDTVFATREEWVARIPLHPDDAQRWRNTIAEHLAGHTARLEIEYRIEPRPGETRWVQVRGQCFRDAQGKPMCMAGSTLDITERKRAEADRERLEIQLRQAQKLEAMGTLAGGIAHDFNNILSAILGYGEMAQKAALENSTLRRQIDNMINAGQRAKSLVERILAFSRSGVGARVPVHVLSTVSETLDLLGASLPAGVRLERELAADDAAVMGDPTQIHQVVMNLGTNAVQAMKTEGTLRVRLDLRELDAPLFVSTGKLAAGKYVRLAVADSGKGIDPQILERIFDPFFTTKEAGVGTGLGLSLVHGIVTDLAGHIEVSSQVGLGSTFVVYLPWHGQVVEAASAVHKIPNGTGQTVLLVDDEEMLVQLGEEMLAQLGYEPVGCTSSSYALETFRSAPERFDAVLTDETMPGMTGSQMTRLIRELRSDIPVILMSGYLGPGLAARARAAGANEVLAKPLASRDIARALATVLRS